MVKASVEIKHNRNNLIEGRSSGISFAFLKEKSRGKYETIMPISPCKDYLNDVVYIENSKRDKSIYGSVYGFRYEKPQNLFKYKKRVPLLVKDINMGNKPHKSIANNHNAVIDFINEIEKSAGISRPTIMLSTNKKDQYVFLISRKWVESPLTISLYSLLIRVGVSYSTEYKNIKKYINSITIPSTEAVYARNIFKIPLGDKILSGEFFDFKYYSNLKNLGIYMINNVHNRGIVTLKDCINESLLKTK